MIVVAFSWLVKATDAGFDDVELQNALDDLTWVLGCMADMSIGGSGGKRAQEDRSETSVKKRYVLSFSISSQS